VTAIPTFAGTVAPAELIAKLDVLTAELEARRVSTAARLTALEGVAKPAGMSLVAPPVAFPISALATPGAAVSRGMATFPGVGLDSDGRAGIVWLTPTRFAVVASENISSAQTQPFARVTLFSVDATTGAPTQLSTSLIGPNLGPAGSYNINRGLMFGGLRLSDTAFKVEYYGQNSSDNFIFIGVTVSVSFDPATNTITSVTDRTVNHTSSASGGAGAVGTSYGHRRRLFPVGLNGYGLARYANVAASATGWAPILDVGERSPGSSFRVLRYLAAGVSTYSLMVDRCAVDMLVMLQEGSATGFVGGQATVSLVHADDAGAGVVTSLRLGVSIAGSPRVTCLSESLTIVAFTSGSQYGTWLIRRNPATNALSVVGSFSTVGALGVAAIEILPLGPTRALILTKAANATMTGTVVSIDPNAAIGTSPFTVVSTFTFNVGAGVAGFTPADAVTVSAVEQITGDRFAISFRNVTRNANGTEVVDLLAA